MKTDIKNILQGKIKSNRGIHLKTTYNLRWLFNNCLHFHLELNPLRDLFIIFPTWIAIRNTKEIPEIAKEIGSSDILYFSDIKLNFWQFWSCGLDCRITCGTFDTHNDIILLKLLVLMSLFWKWQIVQISLYFGHAIPVGKICINPFIFKDAHTEYGVLL